MSFIQEHCYRVTCDEEGCPNSEELVDEKYKTPGEARNYFRGIGWKFGDCSKITKASCSRDHSIDLKLSKETLNDISDAFTAYIKQLEVDNVEYRGTLVDKIKHIKEQKTKLDEILSKGTDK